MPQESALSIAWTVLANGPPQNIFQTADPTKALRLWEGYVAMCSAVFARDDIAAGDKARLAEAFFDLCHVDALKHVMPNSNVPDLSAFPPAIARTWLARTAEALRREPPNDNLNRLLGQLSAAGMAVAFDR